MEHKVYKLVNNSGIIEYIGYTGTTLERRFGSHKKSKFKNRPDVSIELVRSFDNKKEALAFEGTFKIENGFEWTEKIKCTFEDRSRGGKTAIVKNRTRESIRKGAIATTSLRYKCPHCERTMNPGALAIHIKYKHKEIE